MRKLWVLGFLLFATIPAIAQETRGTISGTVRDDQGVIPGATVRVTNAGTGVTQQLTTNDSGYFEARLLIAGNYEVVVEMEGFKTLRRSGITLGSAQQLALQLPLEIGTIAEEITVTGEAPLLEVNTLRQGLVLDEKKVNELPVQSNMPVLFARFAPGMMARGVIPFAGQGFVGGPTTNATPLGGIGGVDWSIDGATNNGVGRQMSTSPNTDMIQEMRVESTNFTASIGHGTGVGITMMTRAGTNTPRGTVNYQYWTNKFNPPNRFQDVVFDADPRARDAYEDGLSSNLSLTFGGPVQIPKVINGTNKLFTFVNYSYGHDDFNGKSANPNRTLPRSDPGHNHLAGDFSDLLLLPNPAQYQIYDPLTTRPDPQRPGHVIRDPFPNNRIPADRIVNPLYKLYTGFLPSPNTNPTASNQQPINNFYDTAQPDPLRSHVFGVRLDYNHSDRNRFFGRVSGSHFTEGAGDWTYESAPGLHALSRVRKTWAGTGNWTRVQGDTVIDGQIGVNRFLETDQRLGLKEYTPGSIGLPAYMDEFCKARGDFGGVTACQLPRIGFGGTTSAFYQVLGDNSGTFDQGTHYQGQLNVSQVRGSHTLRGGGDYRRHERFRNFPGNASGNFTFDNTYTRLADDTTGAANLGLNWAAFMLGIPTRVEAEMTASSLASNHWFGTFFQDTWRVSENVTLNFGLRYEYETGLTEKNDQMLTGFDPNAQVAIAQLAEAAYARNPIPQLAPSAFDVQGGTVYAAESGLSWGAQSMWMPRVSGSWSINERTVLKAGYGMFYDVLNATNFSPNQTGFSSTTANVPSVDFGQTWILGDPKNGITPMANPFPVRSSGTRFDEAVGSSLGANSALGTRFQAQNPAREHPRVQRWRAGVQRELSRNMAVEIAYNGSRGDHLDRTIRQDYLPEQWWNGSNVRDVTQQNLLNANVTNPFFIGNFEPLRTSDPALYNQMAGNSFFTSPTIQRHRLLRPFPHMSSGDGLDYLTLPLGENRAHSLEVSFTRRFAHGFTGSLFYTATKLTENRTLEEYDREPTIWQSTQEARPHRLTADFIAELPFGAAKPYLNQGGVLAAILGGWQVGGTYEWQPGQLLEWSGNAIGSVNNIFFYGNLEDIKIDNPTIDRWFNVDAGFERDPAKIPANFQKRTFPFRIDGVRAPSLNHLNLNVGRTIRLAGSKTLQLRVDALNVMNNETYADPNLNPTSTQFGRITANNGTYMRFVTFVTKLNF
jgi:Carboxypeptidase regulatory-like domain